MKNFDLKKYLAEGRLLKEEVMVNPIIMFGGKKYIEDVISSPDDFGFDKDDAEWVKNNILSSPKMMSIQDYMDLDDKWVKQAQIETGGGGDLDHIVDALKVHIKQGLITPEQEKEAMKVVGLAEGRLLKEALNKSLMDFGKDVKAFLETKDLNVKEFKGDPQPYYKPIGEDPSLAALVLSSQGTELYIIINDSKMNVLEDIVKKYNLKTLVDMKKSGGWDQDTNKKTQSKGEIYMDQEVNKSRKGDTFALNVRKFDPSEIK